MSTFLLISKFYFPPARPERVPRPRLVERLNVGLKGTLTLVSAPAGFGKTSLLSEWHMGSGSSTSTAWLSLDDGDNDPGRFWLYLTTALETLHHSTFDTTRSLLRSPQPILPEAIVSSLIHEQESFPGDQVLVLDDLHLITSPQIHNALAFLIDHLPHQLHLVILTRADPPFPLARLRVRNQLTEIRANDLRFTRDEAAEFLSQTMGISLQAEQIASLEARTEGWIAGLQLAALSMQGREDVNGFVNTFTGSHHYIGDYLVEEVLNLQSEKRRDFLLKTSILERMNASLCAVLTGESDGQAMLEELEQANLFVMGLDDIRQWYRYHHLFADILRSRLQQSDSNQYFELHHRAAEWYERNAFLSDALYHALAAGDQEYAARLVEKNALSMLLEGELTTLLDWLERIQAQVTSRPWLSIYQAWVLVHTGQQEKAATVLDRLEQFTASSVASEEMLEMSGHIAAIRAHIAAYHWDGAKAILYSHQAMELLPKTNIAIRSYVAQVLGGAYLLSGDLEGANRSLDEARRLGKAAGNLHVAVLASCMLANLQVDQGQLHQAVETYREALQLATSATGQPLPVAARAYNGLGWAFYEWNDFETAQHYSNQCIALAQKWGNINALVSANIILAKVKQVQDDFEGAQICIDKARRFAHDHTLAPGGDSGLELSQVSLWLAAGNIEAAGRWLRISGLKIDDEVPPLREAEYRTFARVLLFQNKTDAALALVNRLLSAAESLDKVGDIIRLLALKTLILHAGTDIPPALETLKRALTLAEPEGYIRIFVDQGHPLKELLKRVKSEGQFKKYIHKLLASFNGEPPSESDALIEPLTERELEVLRLVAAGKSNQEIASGLVLSVGTVKKHLSNIFQKLNAESRTHCIALARELNLLG